MQAFKSRESIKALSTSDVQSVEIQNQTNTKLERISYLYDRLSKAEATITELANELRVSTKTIQRDLHEILTEAGATCNGRSWKIDKSKANDELKSDERIILGDRKSVV